MGTTSQLRQHLLFILGFFIIAVFVFVRSAHPDRWSDWAGGDAQTVLATQHWKHEGFWATHFLWIPQGYSSATKLLDDPAVNHHAHGITGRISGMPGQRIAYTHYPSWYAVPYGLLAQWGIEQKSLYQAFALLLSLISLLFLYLYVERIFSAPIATFTVFFYAFSHGFLSYCDSLANIPYDDLFRFGFIYFWDRFSQTKKGFFLCLGLYFLSSLTSLDSIVFIFVWALFNQFLIQRRAPLWSLMALAISPPLAISISWLQNMSYLGAENAWLDWSGTFRAVSTVAESTFLEKIQRTFITIKRLTELSFHIDFGFVWVLVLIASLLWKNRQPLLWKVLLSLYFAGIGYMIVFPLKAGTLAYQMRQVHPVAALAYASCLVGLFQLGRSLISQNRTAWAKALSFGVLIAAVGVAWANTYLRYFPHKVDYPPHKRMEAQLQQQLEQIHLWHPVNKVVFYVGDRLPTINSFQGHRQVEPLLEYFVQAPILHFPNLESLRRDYAYLTSKDRTFTPILLFDTLDDKDSVIKERDLAPISDNPAYTKKPMPPGKMPILYTLDALTNRLTE